MIENINIHTSGEKKESRRNFSNLKPPKNIRQIGQVESNKKIYVEDYVMTYMKQIAMKNYGNYQVAVLLGGCSKSEEGELIFISAAVTVDDIHYEDDRIFSNEAWNGIYEDIKKYFADVEIVGWFITRPGLILELDDKIKKIHVDNFAGEDKTLLMYDSIEREEAFYIFDDNQLKKQTGYYIYYDKNDAMQSYMVDHKEQESIEAEYEDRTTKEIRNILTKKKEPENERNGIPMLYAVSTLLAIVVLIIAAALVQNLDKISSMEQAINVISNTLGGSGNDDPVAAPTDTPTPVSSAEQTSGSTVVEVIEGNVTPLRETVSPNPATETAIPATPTPKPVVTQPVTEITKAPQDNKEEQNQNYYTVKKGDTLVSISKNVYNSSAKVADIMEANNIDNQNYIFVGQKLILP